MTAGLAHQRAAAALGLEPYHTDDDRIAADERDHDHHADSDEGGVKP